MSGESDVRGIPVLRLSRGFPLVFTTAALFLFSLCFQFFGLFVYLGLQFLYTLGYHLRRVAWKQVRLLCRQLLSRLFLLLGKFLLILVEIEFIEGSTTNLILVDVFCRILRHSVYSPCSWF